MESRRQDQASGAGRATNQQSRSPIPMEIQGIQPSPIRAEDEIDLSEINATPRSQSVGIDIYNEMTLLEDTVVGGHQLGLEDDPGSPV